MSSVSAVPAKLCEGGKEPAVLVSPHSFEIAARYEQVYSKVLNNLATTYFRLGESHTAVCMGQ